MSVDPDMYVTVQLTTSVIGLGNKDALVQVTKDRAGELISAQVAQYFGPHPQDTAAPDVATPEQVAEAEQAAAAREEAANGTARKGTRQARPRTDTSTSDASGEGSGGLNNPDDAEHGEGSVAG
jgi:hypothetical protein